MIFYIFKLLKSDKAITKIEGEMIYNFIKEKNPNKIILDFNNLNLITTVFLNSLLKNLVDNRIIFRNIKNDFEMYKLRLVVSNSFSHN